MTNFFDVAHAHSKASNKNSAMAVSGGLSYSPSHGNQEDFDLPPPYYLKHELLQVANGNEGSARAIAELYGVKNFRLTVLGLAKDVSKKSKASRYSCKCSCGMFCLRTARQIRKGEDQACGVCRKNLVRTIRDMGGSKKATREQAWQRMGGA